MISGRTPRAPAVEELVAVRASRDADVAHAVDRARRRASHALGVARRSPPRLAPCAASEQRPVAVSPSPRCVMSVERSTSRTASSRDVGDQQPRRHRADVDRGDLRVPRYRSRPRSRSVAPRVRPRPDAFRTGRLRQAMPNNAERLLRRSGRRPPASASATCACRHFTPSGSRCPAIPTPAQASTRRSRSRTCACARWRSWRDAVGVSGAQCGGELRVASRALGPLGEHRPRTRARLPAAIKPRTREPVQRGERVPSERTGGEAITRGGRN